MRVVVFDLETGGLDPELHAITQIAAQPVEFETFTPVGEPFECKVKFRPESATADALLMTSYDPDVWERDAVPPADACAALSQFLREYSDVECISKRGTPYRVAMLAGHNADRFDGPFLRKWYEKLGQFCPAYPAVLDTAQLARWRYTGRGDQPKDFKLGTLCEHFGIETESHDALSDVLGAIEVVKCLRG